MTTDLDLTGLRFPGLTFREAVPDDIPALVELDRAIWPRELCDTEEERRFYWEPLDKYGTNTRIVGEDGGGIVAYCYLGTHISGDPKDYAYIEPEILPRWRRKGIGTLLFRHAETLALRRQAKLLFAWTLSAVAGGEEFLTAMGLAATSRESFSRLVLKEADYEPFRARAEQLQAEGYEFFRLDTRDSPEMRRKAHELAVFIDREMPTDGEIAPDMTYEAWEKMVYGGNPSYGPEHIYIAAKGDELVGMTGLAIEGVGVGNTYTTGVTREHRRKGIAGALKYFSLTWALERGVETVLTSNRRTPRCSRSTGG
jgi:GNAT superfamily N-acetyltransferase